MKKNLSFLLYKYALKPEEFPDQVVAMSSTCVTIKDLYPKAIHHFLVMPRERISNLSSLTCKHMGILNDMKEQANQVIQSLQDKFEFRMGFHAIPSVNHLHLHVISQDFTGTALKTKKHYNSFTTDFFIELDTVLEKLPLGPLELDKTHYESLLKKPMTCLHCLESISNMPTLKIHLQNHIKQQQKL